MNVTETDVVTAFRCASEVMDRRRLSSHPIPAWLVAHYTRMRILSARGQENRDGGTQLEHDDQIGTAAAAAMLNTSTRQVRRDAPKLGGIRPGRDWVFSRRTIEEHVEGKRQ